MARVVSGGQTGVDRAALDWARAVGLDHGGWCPRGGWAEDHPDPPGLLRTYPQLRETPSRDPRSRTWLNVRDSDATLLVVPSHAQQRPSAGTEQTQLVARDLGRPHLVTSGAVEETARVASWLTGLEREVTLNVAGPRESECPGAYDVTLSLLDRLLGRD